MDEARIKRGSLFWWPQAEMPKDICHFFYVPEKIKYSIVTSLYFGKDSLSLLRLFVGELSSVVFC